MMSEYFMSKAFMIFSKDVMLYWKILTFFLARPIEKVHLRKSWPLYGEYWIAGVFEDMRTLRMAWMMSLIPCVEST